MASPCEVLTDYTILEEDPIQRLDVLYGYMSIRPEWVFTLDEYSTRIVQPMVVTLAKQTADAIMYGSGAVRHRYDGLQGLLAESIPLSQLVQDARGATSAIE